MAEASMNSQQTTSLPSEGANVEVYVRWRPLIKEEAGHEEITRTAPKEGAMQRVLFTGQKCLAGTNIIANTVDVEQSSKPLSPRSKRMARLAKKMRKREKKATSFNGVCHGVFEADDNNQTVYENSVKHCVEHVMNGGVGAVFTYGQTGSGKTHTVLGYGEEHGMAYLAMEQMQREVERMKRDDVWVNVSFTEFHKRNVYDLLNNRSAAAARENADGDVVFRKYTKSKDKNRDDSESFEVKKIQCRTSADTLALIQMGIQNRVVGDSNLHSQSSRSHAFLEYEMTTEKIEHWKRFVLEIERELYQLTNMTGKTLKSRCREEGSIRKTRFVLDQSLEKNQIFLEWMTEEQLNTRIPGVGYDGLRKWYNWLIQQIEGHIEVIKTEEGACFKGKMVLVDLAGSEHGADKHNKTQTKEEWQEAKQINISLSALNDVIYAQHMGKKRVPYRASVLTRILRKYISDERCKTVMIGNLSPSVIHSSKTMKTLRYCCMVAKAGRDE